MSRATLTSLLLLPFLAGGASWKAGVAVRNVTPTESMWMAGYGFRNHPSEGKDTELFVKALAVEDPEGGRLVLVASDLIGIPRPLSEDVAAELRKKTGLPRERLMVTCSHTHSGPVLSNNLEDMYPMSETERAKIAPYTKKVRDAMLDVVVEALDHLSPAELSIGRTSTSFAMNRRKNTDKGYIIADNPDGPVDRSVPALRVRSADGKLLAVVFGYACHNTTLQGYRWNADYAGYAQTEIEKKHPGAVALFWTGCAGDANPTPRGKVEMCEKHGRELAGAVDELLTKGEWTPVSGTTAARYATISLPLGELPDRGKLAADLLSKNVALKKRAERLTKILDGGGKLDDHYPHYPIQVWRLGGQVRWVSLGGEVVVDYALRLKKELAGERTVWVTAYSNDVMAYIPSARVLKEGGYEPDTSMIYYGMPTKWSPAVEEKIISRVRELVREVK
jgi:Neutral/alkaline non-lysosomal ceramidase, N-terminal